MTARPLRFGAFLSPIHPLGEDPTLQLERDLQLVELLDQLDYDECWVGEHHSNGWSSIDSPEVVIAAAAQRTHRIKLASGVISLPYHHPFMVASRARQLDLLTRGRFILGVGAGSLPSDAHYLGIDLSETRPITTEALPVVLDLLNGERVSRKTDWFVLEDASLQLPPYRPDSLEVAISSAATPTSMRLAGKYGLSTMSFGAPRPGTKPVDLAKQWEYCEESSAEHGTQVSRRNWRITLGIHVAETREQAFAEVQEGFDKWMFEYWGGTVGFDVAFPGVKREDSARASMDVGSAIIGSVEDCVGALERLYDQTGGFGTFLAFCHDWASWDATKRSYDLLARYVAPHFTGTTRIPTEADAWIRNNRSKFVPSGAGK
jgi:limonene 1,2-monooxygenase